jgi:hypothetical protein
MPRIHLGQISIDVPSVWNVSTIMLSKPIEQITDTPRIKQVKTQQTLQQNIIATIEKIDANENISSYIQRQIESSRQFGINSQEITKPEEVLLHNGQDGVLCERIITAPTGHLVAQLQLVTLKDGFAYLIVASCLYGPSYEKDFDNFREILLSFQ